MEVIQIYNLVNQATNEVLGETAVLNEDLSNLVDIGDTIINNNAVDNYVRSLVNHIGKVIFVNRKYSGNAPSVLMDGWEYGSILQKVTADLLDAEENESWELLDNTSYDPNIFRKPKISSKFFNKKVTFEIPISITEMQVKESFSNAEQLNGFLSMIYNAVDKSMTVKIDSLIQRTINNFIAQTLYNEVPGGVYSGRTGVKAVNLLYMYNTAFSKTLTPEECLLDKDFIRYASSQMKLYKNRMSRISKLFNVGGTDKFTNAEYLHFIVLNDFINAADVYLQSDVFHNELTALNNYEVVPFWQGSGTDYAFNSITKIDVTTQNNVTVSATGILAVMFDRDSLGVTNMDRRVTTNYNPKAEFYNNWYKFDCSYFNDLNENFVVFYVA